MEMSIWQKHNNWIGVIMVSSIRNRTELNHAINSARNVVIMFSMRDCSWCVKQKPYFDKISKMPEMKDIKFFIMTVKVSDQPSVEKEYKLNGYPHTYLFQNGKQVYAKKEYIGYYAMLDLFRKKFR